VDEKELLSSTNWAGGNCSEVSIYFKIWASGAACSFVRWCSWIRCKYLLFTVGLIFVSVPNSVGSRRGRLVGTNQSDVVVACIYNDKKECRVWAWRNKWVSKDDSPAFHRRVDCAGRYHIKSSWNSTRATSWYRSNYISSGGWCGTRKRPTDCWMWCVGYTFPWTRMFHRT
jgi:hypothetical protein